MELLSPTYQFIRNEGRAEGRAEVLAEMTDTLHTAAEVVLRLRFGQRGLDLMPRIRQINDAHAIGVLIKAIEIVPDIDPLLNLLPPQV